MRLSSRQERLILRDHGFPKTNVVANLAKLTKAARPIFIFRDIIDLK